MARRGTYNLRNFAVCQCAEDAPCVCVQCTCKKAPFLYHFVECEVSKQYEAQQRRLRQIARRQGRTPLGRLRGA